MPATQYIIPDSPDGCQKPQIINIGPYLWAILYRGRPLGHIQGDRARAEVALLQLAASPGFTLPLFNSEANL